MKSLFRFVSVLMVPLVVSGPLPAQTAQEMQLKLADSDGTTVKTGSRSAKGFAIQVTDNAGGAMADVAVVLHMPDSGPSGTFGDGSRASVSYTDQTGLARFSGIQWNDMAGSFTIRVTATKGNVHAGMLFDAALAASDAARPPAGSLLTSPPASAPSVAATPANNKPETKPAPVAVSADVQQPGTLDRAEQIPPPARIASAPIPSVSVTNGPTHEKIHSGSGKMKWILIAAIAAGAGAGLAMAGKGKGSSSSSTSTSTGTTIGSPTVSVGPQ
jgi:hypothetical protein